MSRASSGEGPDAPRDPELAGALRGDDSTYVGSRGAGIRLREPLDASLAELRPESAATLARELHWYDKAHLVALHEAGVVDRDRVAACLRELLAVDRGDVDGARARLGHVLHAGEVRLVRALGMDVGGVIHCGRSSWDLEAVAYRLKLRGLLLDLLDGVLDYREALLEQAGTHLTTVLAFDTHAQHAQPSTLAHVLHAHACRAERDYVRVRGALKEVDLGPAGAAAGTATPFPIDRARISALLGFPDVVSNTADAVTSCDHLWDCAAATAVVAAHLGLFGDELITWMRDEQRGITLADRYCSFSSLMTHKRNPRGAEVLQLLRRDVCGRVPTSVGAAELVAVVTDVAAAARIAAGMVRTLVVDVARLRALAEATWIGMSDVAALLVTRRGLAWRVAHQICSIAVRLADDAGLGPSQASGALIDRAAVLFLGRPVGLDDDEVRAALDPGACLDHRTVTGSPGSLEMRRQLAASRTALARDRQDIVTRRARIGQARAELDAAVAAVLA